jgi:hypothetical protein
MQSATEVAADLSWLDTMRRDGQTERARLAAKYGCAPCEVEAAWLADTRAWAAGLPDKIAERIAYEGRVPSGYLRGV